MSKEIMLDPSMFLHRPTLQLMNSMYEDKELDTLYLPSQLIIQLDQYPSPESTEFWSFFIPETDPASVGEAIDFFKNTRDAFQWYESPMSDYPEFYSGLLSETPNEIIARCIFDEWHFLNSRSWLFEQVRKATDFMVRAGSIGIQHSKNAFESLVRATLRLPPGAPLTPKDKLRAGTKWVALGGPTIASILVPAAQVFTPLVGGIAGAFLHFDP